MQWIAMAQRGGRLAVVILTMTTGLSLGLLAGCATVPADRAGSSAQNDPLEPLNRGVFAFNQGLDRVLIKPVAEAYRAVLPSFVRDRIRAFVDNLKEPLVFANDILQGRGTAAAITGKRFVINSTLGLAGFVDRATGLGLPQQSGDFGQTLHVWGLGSGPYLVLPVFGPSNLRDTFGLAVDLYAAPVGHIGGGNVPRDASFSVGAADGVDLRSRNIDTLAELQRNSLDFYAYLRSVWRQQRQAVLGEATGRARTSFPLGDELVDPGAPASALPPSPSPSPSPPVPLPVPTPLPASAPASP